MAKDKKPKSNKLLTGSRLLKAADLGLFWSYVGAVIFWIWQMWGAK